MHSGFRTRSIGGGYSRRHTVSKRMPRSISGFGTSLLRLWDRRPRTKLEWKRFLLKSGGGFVGVLIIYLLILWFTLPDISDPKNFIASQSTVILDREGVELYRLFSEEDRTFIDGERIPTHMKQATVAIEDERFYERGCLDLRAIGRAILFLGQAGGGSTITRQLARNALDLRNENRYQRKLKELVLGCQLEGTYDKEELIELYLNWIPFGSNAYGIEQASHVYFDTSAADLTLAQAAVLAALPQRPTYFSPYGEHVRTEVSENVHLDVIAGEITRISQIDEDEITIGLLGGYAGTGGTVLYVNGRADQVLRNMEDQGFNTEAERLSALEELEVMVFQTARENIRAPHFVLWVRDQVLEMFEGTSEEGILESGGLKIETTLDWELQQKAEASVARYRDDVRDRFGAENIALVALEPRSNEVLAYVGNMDYEDEEHGGKIDMARAPRQPGSSFKPFVYAAAFRKGYGPATPIYDVRTRIGGDEPQNFDGTERGLLTIRQALGASRNIPAAKAYFLAGEEDEILTLVSAMGAPTPMERKEELREERGAFDYGWPLALGAAETPLVEMTNAYGTFARGGIAKPVVSITRITDKQGNILYQMPDKPEEKEVLDPRIAYQITSILSDESVRPNEFWRTQLSVPGFQTAAKTGTSNKCLEWTGEEGQPNRSCKLRKPDNAWVLGYTPNLVVGAWTGNANSAAMYDKGDGLNTTSPLWRDFMIAAHRSLENPKITFAAPENIVQPLISTLSGELPTPCTPIAYRRADVFLRESPPTEADPACAVLVVDRVTNLLASDECPPDARQSGSFLVAHSILADRWPDWEKGVQTWVGRQMQLWNASPDHSGSLLPLPVAPTEKCKLSLTPGRAMKPTVRILTPSDGGIAGFPSFRPTIEYQVGSSVREVRYDIDSERVAVVSSAPFTQVLRAPRSTDLEGSHTLTVTLIDEYYNAASHTVTVRFEPDEGLPSVSFIEPSDDITRPQSATLTLRADADDPEGGIKYVQFYLDDTLLSTKPTAPYGMEYPLKDVSPGVHHVTAKAVDLGGNTAEAEIMLTVE